MHEKERQPIEFLIPTAALTHANLSREQLPDYSDGICGPSFKKAKTVNL